MRLLSRSFLIAAAAAMLMTAAPAAQACDEVWPGIDLFRTPTPDESPTSLFLALPADFFGLGSDPVARWVQLEGDPIVTVPPGLAGTADTIVERLASTGIFDCGTSAVVEIVLRALSLKPSAPTIAVTYGGGSPELWTFKVRASAVQQHGTMTISCGCDIGGAFGGTFTAELSVKPVFRFKRLLDNLEKVLVGPDLALTTVGVGFPWMDSDPSGDATTSPGNFSIDADGDGTFETSIAAGTSNFVPTLEGSPCTCGDPPTEIKPRFGLEEKPQGEPLTKHVVTCAGCVPKPQRSPIPEDPFLCYKARDRHKPAMNPFPVSIVDQFDNDLFDPGRAEFLCTPAVVNPATPEHAANDEEIHLKAYRLRRAGEAARAVEPRHPPFRVTTTDDFGALVLRLTSDKNFELMVPTTKKLVSPPPDAPVPGTHQVNHFKCYRAHLDKTVSPLFPLRNLEVAVRDQFGARIVRLRSPHKVCAPASKNDEGMPNPKTHRTCYRVRGPKAERVEVEVNNQFGPESLRLRAPRLLCVPSDKTVRP